MYIAEEVSVNICCQIVLQSRFVIFQSLRQNVASHKHKNTGHNEWLLCISEGMSGTGSTRGLDAVKLVLVCLEFQSGQVELTV